MSLGISTIHYAATRNVAAPLDVERIPAEQGSVSTAQRWLAPIGLSLAVWLAGVLAPQACYAGMGPENLVVVVNADSIDSRTIANHYVQLRSIPSRNVILLEDVPDEMVTDLDSFRESILKPVLAEIERRQLTTHVRGIAYSAGFPYAVRIGEHRDRLQDPDTKKAFTGTASINGLTYLFRFVLADREDYLSGYSNLYARREFSRNFVNAMDGEDGERFDAAKTLLDEGQYREAAEAFDALFEQYPNRPPLAILAAKAWAQAGEQDRTLAQLAAAAAAGWTGGRWVDEQEEFESLRQAETFQELVQRMGDAPVVGQHPIGFEATRAWGRDGWWARPEQGVTYMPSCMLAVTRGQGTTVPEAIGILTRAAAADHTFPNGTVYLTTTKNVRTRTREPRFPEAMLYLRWQGRRVALEPSALPEQRGDVIGVTFGTAKFDWPSSKSVFLPGAIADNLTSTSGAMKGSGQTKLTELLRSGAAIASGTVTEPYALQIKFPLPSIHAYYAAGLTAIESYYLSVTSPYQLLIVGDPLCQPFARRPDESVSGSKGEVDGVEALIVKTGQPSDALPPERTSSLSEVELYLDGRLVTKSPPLDAYRLKIGGIPGGAYELRVVLIGDPILAPRKTSVDWFEAPGLYPPPTAELESITAKSTAKGNASDAASSEPNAQASKPGRVGSNDPQVAKIRLSAVGADRVWLEHFGTEVAAIDTDEGSVQLDLEPLGYGPIRLRPKASFRGTELPGREITVDH